MGGSPGSSSRSSTASHSCHMCNKKFSRADILRKHVKTHVNSSCTVCGQICNDKVALAKHQVEVGHDWRALSTPKIVISDMNASHFSQGLIYGSFHHAREMRSFLSWRGDFSFVVTYLLRLY